MVPSRMPEPASLRNFNDRIDVIDAFRAICILSVIAFHYLLRLPEPYHYDTVFHPLFELGRYGVHVFFVISGMVISMTLLRSKSALDFGVKRFARLYPAYFVMLTLGFVLMTAFGPEQFKTSFVDYLMNIPLLAEDTKFALVDGLYWSLVVECKFYLFAALFYLLLKERFWMGLVAMGGLVELGIGRGIFIGEYLPYFLIGIFGYYALFGKQFWPAILTGGMGLLLFFDPRQMPPLEGAPVFILGLTAAMFAMLAWCPRLKLGPLAFLGRISYALYLVHHRTGLTLIGYLKETFHMPDLLAVGIVTCLAIGFATLVYYGIEKPCQKRILEWWRNRPVSQGLPVVKEEAGNP